MKACFNAIRHERVHVNGALANGATGAIGCIVGIGATGAVRDIGAAIGAV